jgi:hypothetical protein
MHALHGLGFTAAATSQAFAWLWGSLAVVVFGVYMAVYLLVRTKWGHKPQVEATASVTGAAEPGCPPPTRGA